MLKKVLKTLGPASEFFYEFGFYAVDTQQMMGNTAVEHSIPSILMSIVSFVWPAKRFSVARGILGDDRGRVGNALWNVGCALFP